MSNDTTHDLVALKAERKRLRFQKSILEDRQQDLKKRHREVDDEEIREKLQRDRDLVDEELAQIRVNLSDLAEAIRPLEDLDADERDTFNQGALNLLRKIGADPDSFPEGVTLLLASSYRDARSEHPEWLLPRMQDLTEEFEILTALGWIQEDVYRFADETWPAFHERVKGTLNAIPKSSRDVVKAHCAMNMSVPAFRPGAVVATLANMIVAKAMADDLPTDIDATHVPCVVAFAQHVLGTVTPQPYLEFAKAYWKQQEAEYGVRNPFLLRVIVRTSDDPGECPRHPRTALWFGSDAMPNRTQVEVFNQVISPTLPAFNGPPADYYLGAPPLGCTAVTSAAVNPGHQSLLRVVRAAVRFPNFFVLNRNLTDTSKDDTISHFAFIQPLVWMAGLGLDAVRLLFQQLEANEVDGADHYAAMTDDELRRVLVEIASINSDPACGFAVLRPDFSAYVACCEETGLVPVWMRACLLLTMFKYVSLEVDQTGGEVLVLEYRDRHAVIPVAKDFLHQPLSEGTGNRGNAPLRAALERHLRLTTSEEAPAEVTDAIAGVVAGLFSQLRPVDFPQREALSSNPFLIVPPSPQSVACLNRDERKAFVDVQRAYEVYRFDPSGGAPFKDRTTPEETLLYAWPRAPFDPVRHAEFEQAMPESISPQKPSAILGPYLRNLDDLGQPNGLLATLDVLIGADLVKQVFPAAPIVMAAAGRETPLVYHVPTDASGAEVMTNQGKTRTALALAGIGNLQLQTTPTKGDDSAPSQRTLVTAFYQNDCTFFADDVREITNPNHLLHETNLRTIATEGRGASAGLAGKNAQILAFKHPVTFTCKYIPQEMPDLVNRAIPLYHRTLSAETRMSDEQFAFFSSMRFRLTARLSYLAWMFTSGFAQSVKQATPRSGFLRYTGHNGLGAWLLGDGKAEGSLDSMEAYLRIAQGEKCRSQFLAACESGVVEYSSGRAVVDPAAIFQQVSEGALRGLANEIRSKHSLSSGEIWKYLITEGCPLDYARAMTAHGFHKVALQKCANLLNRAVQEGRLQRPDGWRLDEKSVTLASGARTKRLILTNDLVDGCAASDWSLITASWNQKTKAAA